MSKLKKIFVLLLVVAALTVALPLSAADIDISMLAPDEPIPTPSQSFEAAQSASQQAKQQRIRERIEKLYETAEKNDAEMQRYEAAHDGSSKEKMAAAFASLYLQKDSAEAKEVAAVPQKGGDSIYGLGLDVDPESVQPVYAIGITDWLEGGEPELTKTPEEEGVYLAGMTDEDGRAIAVSRIYGGKVKIYFSLSETLELRAHAALIREKLAQTDIDLSAATAKYLVIPDFFEGYLFDDGKTEALVGGFYYDPYDSPKLKDLYAANGISTEGNVLEKTYAMTREQASELLKQIDYVQKPDVLHLYGYVPLSGGSVEELPETGAGMEKSIAILALMPITAAVIFVRRKKTIG